MSFKIITKILISCFIVITGVFGVWFFFVAQKADDNVTDKNNTTLLIFKEEKNEKTNSVSSAPPASAQTKKYENVQYGFSFNYPDGFMVSKFAEEERKTALTMQNAKTGKGLQIYITAYDDPSFAVSAKRIRRDIPDLPFSNSADVVVGGKAKGVAFFSQNEAFGGDTAEVWFADGKNFYQATARTGEVKLLEEMIKSWKFR